MAKKRNPSDDLSMAYSIQIDHDAWRRNPKRLSRDAVYLAAIKAARSGSGKLPEGVEITWEWRNSKKQQMRSDSFAAAVKKSRASFRYMMANRLLRDALAHNPAFEAPPPPPTRRATKREIAALERHEDLQQELRAERGSAKGSNTRARETKAKRSAAAKQGWKTRRANAAAAKRKRNRK